MDSSKEYVNPNHSQIKVVNGLYQWLQHIFRKQKLELKIYVENYNFQKYNRRTRIILALKNNPNLYKLLNKNKKC